MTAYVMLGWIITSCLLSVPEVARFLQKYMNKALGPILIATGLILLGIINIHLPGISLSEKHHNKLAASGAPGAFLLGLIFALAFCPISAALFFGSLIPLALNDKVGTVLPLVYGVGTALPVLVFALAITLGVTSLGHWFHKITRLERHMRKLTGAIFVIVGLYYMGAYILQLF